MTDGEVKPVVWVGNSLKQVQDFPVEVRQDVGSALYDVQKGDKPTNAKPLAGVGSGVLEIVTRFDTDTYRTVYTVQLGKRVYVLHAFKKKSPKGKKMANADVDLIKRRYKLAVEMEKEYGQ